MWRRLTLLGVLLGLLAVLVLPLQAKPPKPPSAPPSGPGLIAFNDGVGVAVMNPDGTARTRVATLFNAGSVLPVWSHMFSDGTVKLFWRESNLSPLMVVNVFPQIGVPTAVLDVDVPALGDFNLAPSVIREDGTETVRICYHKTIPNPDGPARGDIKIIQLVYDPQSGAFTVDPDTAPLFIEAASGVHYWNAEFSPEGTWIAFQRDELGDSAIWVVKSDGTAPPVLVADAPGFGDGGPTWSPDGTRLAFASNRDARQNQVGDIYIAALNPDMSVQSIERKTNSTRIVEGFLSWSPADANGEQICYGSVAVWGYWPMGKVMLSTGQQYDLGYGAFPTWSRMDLPKLPW